MLVTSNINGCVNDDEKNYEERTVWKIDTDVRKTNFIQKILKEVTPRQPLLKKQMKIYRNKGETRISCEKRLIS